MVRFCIDSSKYDPNFHTIISGPYSDLNQCYSPCGANDPSITTTSTTTTIAPGSLTPVPPLICGDTIININDVEAIVEIQYQVGTNWYPITTRSMAANSITRLPSSYPLRARASILDNGTSGWSSGYNYTSTNILTPSVNGDTIVNSNSFSVFAMIQYQASTNWYDHVVVEIAGGATFRISSSYPLRARFASTGLGTSVTPWSS